MNYARGLRWAREKARLSKAQLAARAGLDASYITHLEAGRKVPSLEALESLAHAVQIPVSVIMLSSSERQDLEGVSARNARELAEHLVGLLELKTQM